MNFFQKIWKWLIGDTSMGHELLNALQTPGPVSYNKDSKTGETSGGLSSIMNRVTQDDLTGAENHQNQFNAEQAQINRDWQEQMSNTQYQRGVADMQAAGLNPALMMGKGASPASTPSGSAASGSLGSSPIGLSEIMQLAGFKKQLQLLDAQIRSTDAGTLLTKANTEYRHQEISIFRPMSDLQMKNLEQDLKNKEVQARLDESGISLNEASKALQLQQKMLLSIDESSRAELNRLEIRKRLAEVGYTTAQTKVARKTLDKIDAEINELYQRAIQESCNAGLMDQQTRNLLLEAGILTSEGEEKAYRVKHKKLTYTLDCVGKALGSVASVAGTFGALGVGARSFGMVGNAAQSMSAAFARQYSSPSASLPINAWTMRDYDGNYSRTW